MASRRKSWTTKMLDGRMPEVRIVREAYAGMARGSRMLISSPTEIAAYLRTIPAGESRSVVQLRADLARVHGADGTCPLTTGIFMRIVAEAAWEELQAGADPGEITPFWRVIAPDSRLAHKLACGADFIAGMRLNEQAAHMPYAIAAAR